MRPRVPIHRILSLRPLRPPNSARLFMQNRFPRSRPQLPFLSHGQHGHRRSARPPARFLSTENKKYLKDSAIHTVKYGSYFVAFYYLIFLMLFGVQQEFFERNFPTPPEWSWTSRETYRTWRWKEENDIPPLWYKVANMYRELIKRLEDPKIDGADLKEQAEGGILVEGIGKTGFDITSKSAAWRQGYHGALMGMARAAEHLDEWVVDTTRDISFPANTVIGPSNTNRKPIGPLDPLPPREENCKPACEGPEIYYMRILTTSGFTSKQRLDAALAYASWLDFKKTPSAAYEMYLWALDIATSSSPYAANPSQILDSETHVLKAELESGLTSINSNVFRASTAISIHYARNGSMSAALPMFLSILRARRALPEEPKTMRDTLIPDEAPTSGVIDRMRDFVEGGLRALISAPLYPLDTDDGTGVPIRDAKNKCEEAALMAYIGEILYASAPSPETNAKAAMTARENGLAWTREAVDIAEENWRGKVGRSTDSEAKRVCKECLEAGLVNWAQMIEILVREEKEMAEKARFNTKKSWFGGGQNEVEMIGRWESEDGVVKERIRRAKEIVEKQELSELMKHINKEFFGGVFRGWLLP